jgi:hypothetical protein
VSDSTRALVANLTFLAGSFINRISSTRQKEEPPQFYGGIVADPMGLGKTLTMIALAASDLNDGTHSSRCSIELESRGKHCIAATLIIIPPPRESQRFNSETGYLLTAISPRYLGRAII